MLLVLKLIPLLIVGAVGGIRVITSIKMDRDFDKRAPFECGFDPTGSARVPFSLRYFLLAVYFLIFDIEIVFLFPLAILDVVSGLILVFVAVFVGVLLIGLIHEWREGSLN